MTPEREALYMLLLDPLSVLSHGALACAKAALGIEHVPSERHDALLVRVRDRYEAEKS